MKLLGSTESKITKDKNGENLPPLEVVELVLVHCNLVNNECNLCNGLSIKMRYSIEPKERRYVKGYGFLSFARNIGTHAAKVAKNMSKNIFKNLLTQLKNLQMMQ